MKGGEEEDAAVTRSRRALGTCWGRGERGGPAAPAVGHLLSPRLAPCPRAVAAGAAGAGPAVRSAQPGSALTLFPAR